MQCRHFTIRLTPQHLIEDEERLNIFLRQVQVHSVQTSLVAPKGERWSVLVFFEERAAAAGGPVQGEENPQMPPLSEAVPELSPAEQRVYERLRAWRGERARADGVPPYVVAHNATLLQIARQHMSLTAAEDLAPLSRFGAQRATRYGADILQLLLPSAQGEADGELVEDNYVQ
jgi:superfamily II DNA helicase RecQ